MNKITLDLPYVVFSTNPDTSERYVMFMEKEDGYALTDRPSDATRFPTARLAYEFTGQRKPNSSLLKYRALQEYRVGRRTY